MAIWAILAEKNEDKVDVNHDESLTDLQTLIKYSFLLNFLHESVMNLTSIYKNTKKKPANFEVHNNKIN